MPATRASRLSEGSLQLLARLAETGGCPFIRLSQVAYGVPTPQLSTAERLALTSRLRGLERRGHVRLLRDWGTLGDGRPTWIEVTPQGTAALRAAGERQLVERRRTLAASS